MCALALILLWMSLQYREGRFSLLSLRQGHYIYLTMPIFLFEFAMLLRSLKKAEGDKPFQWSVLLFLTLVVGLAAALYPSAIPPSLTIFDAAAPARSLLFLFVVTRRAAARDAGLQCLAVLVFRGKVGEGGQEDKARERMMEVDPVAEQELKEYDGAVTRRVRRERREASPVLPWTARSTT